MVGDCHYGGSVRRRLWRRFKTLVVAPAQIKQKGGVISWRQLKLLKTRPKVEVVFGLLKEKLRLATSCSRSVGGYFVHYLRILLGYQVAALMG